jgi:DNA (cytosine-5)-methyltransferase 1
MTPNPDARVIPYAECLEQELPHLNDDITRPLAVDLFSGAGGLALGFEAFGFRSIGYESRSDAAETYRSNLVGDCVETHLAKGFEIPENVELVIAGPPCQPFSVGGLQLGLEDSRDGFPVFLDIVERHRPRLAIFENVRGLLYRARSYFSEILGALERLGYTVDARVLRAVDYGVPQKRERLFVVAYHGSWTWPRLTHTRRPYTAGQALGALAFSIPPDSKFLTPSMDDYIARYEAKSKCIRPRDLHLDKPARTITCRNLAGATSDMQRICLPDGRRRRITVQEAARLQSFPDWFVFYGSEKQQFEQVGNAVPPLLAKAVACSAWANLFGEEFMYPDLEEREDYAALTLW